MIRIKSMADNDYDNKNISGKGCYVGIQNSKELEKTNMRMEMMIENINQNIANLGTSMDKKFDELDTKITKMDSKIDSIQDSMPAKMDEIVNMRLKDNIFSMVKWVVITAGGSVTIALITKMVLSKLPLI